MENTNIIQNKKKSKGFVVDIIAALLATIIFVVCLFLGECKFELPATILALVVILAGSGLMFVNHKRNIKNA